MSARLSGEALLRGAVAGLLAVVTVTGLVTLPFRVPAPWVQLLQLAHGALGVVLVPWIGLYVVVHLIDVFGASVRGARKLPWILPLGLLALVAIFLYPPGERVVTAEQRSVANAHNRWIALAVLAYLVALTVRAARRGVRASTATGLLLVALGVVTSLSGVLTVGGIAANGLWLVHLVSALLVLLVVALHVAGSRRRARSGGEGVGRVFAWRKPLVWVALPVAVAALVFVVGFARRNGRATQPLVADELALVDAGKDFASIVPDACDGCHISVTATWRQSTHAYAAQNPLFTGMVRRLAVDRGGAAVVECLSCHAPHAADPRRASIEAVIASAGYVAGVHCVTCHRMTGTPGDAPLPIAVLPLMGERRRFLSELAGAFPDYLRSTSELPSVLVSSRVPLHRQEFHAPLAAPASCAPCHRQTLTDATGGRLHDVVQDQFGSWERAAGSEDRTSCARCHLPPFYAFEGYVVRDHRFLGGSTYVARVAGGESAEGEVVAHLQGGMPIPARGTYAEPPAASLALLAMTAELARGGGGLALRVETRVADRVGHAFAEGPNDLTQTWLALRVSTVDGRELVRRGLDGPEDGVRLGKRLWDADGAPISDHRLWAVARVERLGEIPAQGARIDQLALPVGADAERLRVELAWKYRRHDPATVRAITGEEPQGLPIVTVATLAGELAEGSVLSSAPR